MTNAEMWFYTRELRRKQTQLEVDRDRVQRLLARPDPPNNRQTRQRLKLELDCIEIRLTKVRRGLLY